jgi:hypothetical protein
MDELVGDDIAEPVRGAAQFVVVIEGRRPDLDGIEKEHGGAVGVVVVILEDDADTAARFVVVELGNRTVCSFGDLCGSGGRLVETLMIEDAEMLGVQNTPFELGVILGQGRNAEDGEEYEGAATHRLTAILTTALALSPLSPVASS